LTRDNKKEKSSAPTDNQIYEAPANQFSPSAGTILEGQQKRKIVRPNQQSNLQQLGKMVGWRQDNGTDNQI